MNRLLLWLVFSATLAAQTHAITNARIVPVTTPVI